MAAEMVQDTAMDSLSISERSLSRHSSIQGPYRDGMKDTSFPIYRKSGTPGSVTSEIYARSLLSTGNGTALSNVKGDEGRPEINRQNGAFLGDVGYVDHSGYFSFAFNIFSPSDHPIHKYGVPTSFSPALSGLSKEDSMVIPNYHPPGSVIASQGIKMTQVSDPPAIQFETSALEGSVLILPTGSTREDLVEPSRFFPYLKEHAVSWYRYYNGGSDRTAHDKHVANGTLCVVTGVDRVESWAMATFPPWNEKTGKARRFRYIAHRPDSESPWEDDIETTLYEANHMTDGTVGAIFLRVITIALSSGEWSRNVAYIPPDEVQSYATVSTRMFGLGPRIQRSLPRFQLFSKQSAREESEIMFHPSIILLNILILTEPSATVAIVPDSVWCSQLSGEYLTHPEVVALVKKVIENFEIENKDGIVIFSPKKDNGQSETNQTPKSSWAAIASYIRFMILWADRSKPKDLRTKALENMNKVLSI